MNAAFSVIWLISLSTVITEIIYYEEINKVLIRSAQLTLRRSPNSNRNTQKHISSAPIYLINILTLLKF